MEFVKGFPYCTDLYTEKCMFILFVCPLLGNYGKLGHGDNVTHKLPKLIEFFVGKVC